MAYHLWDGFDNYSAATELWPTVSGTVQYSSSYARFSAPTGLLGQGMRIPPGGAGWKIWNMASNQQTMIFGFAIFLPNLGGVGFNRIMQFSDASTVQCSLCVNNTGQLGLIKSFNGSTLASSAPAIFTPGVWHWLDVVVTISSTVGTFQVYIDQPSGSSSRVINASGLNNQSTGNSYMNQFVIGDFGNTFLGIQFDDFHAHDNTGSAPNSVLGDSRIYTKVASGAGYTTNWAPTGAAANWQCSNEAPPDGDTSYNASNAPGAIDGYAVSNSGLRFAPNGLVRRSYVRRDDAGPHTFQNGVRSGSTNAFGNAFTVPSSYAWTDGGVCYVNDPATGSKWAASAADSASMVIDETT